MKSIIYSKTFVKHFKKRIENKENLEKRLVERVNLFLLDKMNPILKDHALTGKKQGLRAFSIAGDLRIIYIEAKDSFEFLDIGSHNQVYK